MNIYILMLLLLQCIMFPLEHLIKMGYGIGPCHMYFLFSGSETTKGS